MCTNPRFLYGYCHADLTAQLRYFLTTCQKKLMMKATLTMAGSQTHAVKVRNTLGHLNKAAKTKTITRHQLFHSLLPGLEKRPRLHVAGASLKEGKA